MVRDGNCNKDQDGSKALKTALVTGAAGFLGSHLSERLVQEGWNVVGIDTLITGNRDNVIVLEHEPRFTLLQEDAATLRFTGAVDVVYHLGSLASPKAYMTYPVETLKVGSFGTFNMIDIARANQARFILASSSEVYGDPLVHPQTESYWGNVNPVGPRSVYDESKRFSEAVTACYTADGSLDSVILRIFNTYGPRMNPNDGRIVPTFIRQALAGDDITVFGDGNQTRSLCYVSDLVEALYRCGQQLEIGARVMNLGNPEEHSVNELADIILRVTNSQSPKRYLAPMADEPRRRRPDITIAMKELRWSPQTALRDGLRTTSNFFRKSLEL